MLIYRVINCEDNPVSRHESAHRLLSQMLSDYTAHSYDELKKDSNGKPYIDSVVFSVSHCADIAVVAMCIDESDVENDTVVIKQSCNCVGVDIESVFNKSREKCERIALHRFFDRELALLESCADDEDYVETFCKLWTVKESYCKFTGAGLCDALGFDTQKECDRVEIHSDIITVNGRNYAISFCYNSISE